VGCPERREGLSRERASRFTEKGFGWGEIRSKLKMQLSTLMSKEKKMRYGRSKGRWGVRIRKKKPAGEKALRELEVKRWALQVKRGRGKRKYNYNVCRENAPFYLQGAGSPERDQQAKDARRLIGGKDPINKKKTFARRETARMNRGPSTGGGRRGSLRGVVEDWKPTSKDCSWNQRGEKDNG